MQHPLPRQIFDRLAATPGQVLVMRHDFSEVPIHWHDYYEFVYVTEGEATHRCNGQDVRVAPGSAMLLGPTDFHGYSTRPGGRLRCFNLAIDPHFMEQRLTGAATELQLAGAWSTPDLSDAAGLVEQIWSESTSPDPGSTLMLESLLLCVLIKLARLQTAADPTSARPSDHGIRRALYYLERHFRDPLSLADVAGQAHMSPNHFSERFHDFTGSPFQTYLQHRRLRFARSLLRSSDLPVGDAARAAGLHDPSHFARAYRQLFGHPPSIDRRAG